MRQIWIPKYGKPDVLEVRQAPDPNPQAGEVRVRVAFSGVNFADVMARLGIYPDAPSAPMVVGYEVSGTIDAVGAGVDEALIGTRVMAMTRFGGYSDVVCVPQVQAILMPDSMSFEDAAALPLNTMTAYQMLVAMGRVNNGDKVLIHGAAGGVGWMAVQIAQVLGATIYGTASASKHQDLYELGVTECIDYRNKDFVAEVMRITDGAGVEVALDPIGGRHWVRSYKALAPTGRLIMFGVSSMAPNRRRSPLALARFALGFPWLGFRPLTLINENKGVLGVNLGHLWDQTPRMRGWADEFLGWYEKGWLKPRIDTIIPFEHAAQAHERLQSRQNIGKVLLKP